MYIVRPIALLKTSRIIKKSNEKKVLKGSQDSIPSPSENIQIIGRKVYSRCKGKTLLGDVNKLSVFKVF